MSTDKSQTTAATDPLGRPPGGRGASAPDDDHQPLVDLAPPPAADQEDSSAADEDANDAENAHADRVLARRRARTPGERVRAADGQWESYQEEDEEDASGDSFEPLKTAVPHDEWPVLNFDIALLTDPITDPERHNAELWRVYNHFDPYLRYYFEDVMGYRDVDVITSEVWYRALRRFGSLDAPENAWWWLVRIGRNYFFDQHKQDRRRLVRDRKGLDQMTEDAPEDWGDLILDEISHEEPRFRGVIDRQKFRKAFAKLNGRDHEFACLLKVQELSHEEVVARLKLKSVDASRQRWRWIKKKLIALMEES